MRRRVGIAHQKAPRRAELGVDVRARRNAVFAQTRAQRVDAVAAFRIVGAFGCAGDKAGVVDQKVDVRKALGDAPDVDTRRVLIRLRPERQSLVNCDIANAELPRFLDERKADVVVEEETLPVRTPLRISLPRGDRIALRQHIHAVEIASLIGIHTPVQQDAVRAFHLLDDVRGRLRLLDRQRLVLAC